MDLLEVEDEPNRRCHRYASVRRSRLRDPAQRMGLLANLPSVTSDSAVIWTATAAAAVALSGRDRLVRLVHRFVLPGRKAMGCSAAGFWRSLWVVGVALIMAASAIDAGEQPPHSASSHAAAATGSSTFGGYTVWSFRAAVPAAGLFFARLVRVLPSQPAAVITAAAIFASAHLPNPILTPLTLIWGWPPACLPTIPQYLGRWPWRMPSSASASPSRSLDRWCTICASGLGYLSYRAPRQSFT